MTDREFGELMYFKILSYHNFKETNLNSTFLSIYSVIENFISMIKK